MESRIRCLTKAAKITKDIFKTVSKKVKPGVRESEIRDLIESLIKEKGLKRSFKTIVASGPNAAVPHAKVTNRKIKKIDMVVIDFGVIYKSYHSDLTRTLALGKQNKKLKKLYNSVKRAQAKAINMVKPGVRISELAKATHDSMRKEGFGKYILHSLGHGVGKRIHEPPKLSEKNKRRLKKNTVITIEPGLYIKSKTGVRIEDMICVTKRSARVLTR